MKATIIIDLGGYDRDQYLSVLADTLTNAAMAAQEKEYTPDLGETYDLMNPEDGDCIGKIKFHP